MKKVIEVKDLCKEYKLYENKLDPIKEIFSRKKMHKTKMALKNVSFDVYEKETFGILGGNGSGKSTILQIINGTTFKTSGKVSIEGNVALLNVSAGLLGTYTGMENIYYKCGLLGMRKKEIDAVVEDIIEFSELKEYINQELNKYSAGMKSKLGFAINIHINPDILIVDEALAVGDASFREKCHKKIDEMKKNGLTILYVSHDKGLVSRICERACWIQQGELICIGKASKVSALFEEFMLKKKSLIQIKKDLKENKYDLH